MSAVSSYSNGLVWRLSPAAPVARRTLHLRMLFVYTVLSLTDLFLTWHLIKHGGGKVYESNPIANVWLSSFGWMGLAMFKLLTVGLVGGLSLIISYYKPGTSGRLLIFACCAVGLVVLYSCSLLVYAPVQ